MSCIISFWLLAFGFWLLAFGFWLLAFGKTNYNSVNTAILNKYFNLRKTDFKSIMGEQKRKEAAKTEFIFGKKNYKFMFIGLAFVALGFILMSGGGSDDPNVFNPEIFNFRRIRLAPMLVLIGFGIEIYAILLDPDKQ